MGIHPPAANMKLTTSFLLPLLVGAASAITDASVYIFDAAKRPSTSPPSLSPEQARLVFAQRLGASQYHGIGDASEVTLSYVNRFGGPQESLFQDKTDKVAEIDELMAAQKRLVQFAQKAEMNVVVVLMPESSRTSKSSSKPYGSYDRPSQVSIGKVRRQAAEEPITEAPV